MSKLPHWRPRTRADCVDGPRPCPYVGCRHHLWMHVHKTGRLSFVGGEGLGALWAMANTCSLDVADLGPATIIEIAAMLKTYRQLVQSIEASALRALRGGLNREDRTLVKPPPLMCTQCGLELAADRRTSMRCRSCAARKKK